MMSELKVPGNKALGVMVPESVSLLQWTAIINAADYFLGCDSVGQHIAHALKKPGTVVIGGTFPENISYPSSSTLTIIDNGKDERKYSPIRVAVDIRIDRHNENLMVLSDETVKTIVKQIKTTLGKTAKAYVEPKQAAGCSAPGCA
jgi:ADP-heptose:LPS heptosyltransferase